MSNTNTMSRAAQMQSGSAAAVARSAALGKRPFKKREEFTPEQRAKYAAEKAKHRQGLSHWSAFPVDRLAVYKEGDRTKVAFRDPSTNEIDKKGLAVIEMPPLLAIGALSHLSKEGNLGLPGELYEKDRGIAKRSVALTQGTSHPTLPLPEHIALDQQRAIEVVQQASVKILRSWFNETASKDVSVAYENARSNARFQVAADLFAAKKTASMKTPPEIVKMEAQDPEVAKAVHEAACDYFVEHARIPFKLDAKDAEKKKTPAMYAEGNVWKIKEGTGNIDRNREKGPKANIVPVGNANMPRLLKMMDAINYEFKVPTYENVAKAPGAEGRKIIHPTITLRDTDETGKPLNNDDGTPKMITIPDINFDPAFVRHGQLQDAMLQTSVLFGVTDGGKGGRYGIKMTLSGPIGIFRRDPRQVRSMEQYDDDPYGNGFDEDEDEFGAEEDQVEPTEQVATGVSLVGLPGGAPSEPAQLESGGNAFEPDELVEEDVPPPPTKRGKK